MPKDRQRERERKTDAADDETKKKLDRTDRTMSEGGKRYARATTKRKKKNDSILFSMSCGTGATARRISLDQKRNIACLFFIRSSANLYVEIDRFLF